MKADLSTKVIDDGYDEDVVRLDDITSVQTRVSDDQVAIEIYDTLYSYYQLSRKRFVDNVRMQVADHFLVTGPNNPLRLFSPKYVASMTAEQLEEIAGEEYALKRRRLEVEKEIERLKQGRRILQ